MNPEKLLFAKTHEWVRLETDAAGAKIAVVGISSFAVEALTDLVFMDLPAVGQHVTAGQAFGEIESVKAVSDLYSPVDGEVIEVNTALSSDLGKLNHDPYGEGWIAKIKLKSEQSLSALLNYAAYQQQCAAEGH